MRFWFHGFVMVLAALCIGCPESGDDDAADDDVADDDTAGDDDTGDDDTEGDDDTALVPVAPCEFGGLSAAFETVTASFSGDAFPAATLSARGVAPLDTDLAGVYLPLLYGEDHVVTWTAGPDPDACVSLLINGHNAGHGLPLGDIIWCVGPDDGSLTIPQAVFEPFPYGQWQGSFDGTNCPGFDCLPSELSRYTRNVVDAEPGPVELIVRSTIQLGWNHID